MFPTLPILKRHHGHFNRHYPEERQTKAILEGDWPTPQMIMPSVKMTSPRPGWGAI